MGSMILIGALLVLIAVTVWSLAVASLLALDRESRGATRTIRPSLADHGL
ncbi:MAG TPA: hypothetical protein VF221_23185 [Chloroflexota bacterium]